MRSVLLVSILVLSVHAATATTQQRATDRARAKPCGTWQLKITIGPRDSVVATPVLTVTPNGKRSLTFAGRAPLSVRELARGGDSVVMAIGPYRSILDSTQMVTTRATAHFGSSTMTGLLDAHYASGKVLPGKIVGTCAPTAGR